jgi:hypothetical protein
MPTLSAKELTTDLLIRYGFQIVGALVILRPSEMSQCKT